MKQSVDLAMCINMGYWLSCWFISYSLIIREGTVVVVIVW